MREQLVLEEDGYQVIPRGDFREVFIYSSSLLKLDHENAMWIEITDWSVRIDGIVTTSVDNIYKMLDGVVEYAKANCLQWIGFEGKLLGYMKGTIMRYGFHETKVDGFNTYLRLDIEVAEEEIVEKA